MGRRFALVVGLIVAAGVVLPHGRLAFGQTTFTKANNLNNLNLTTSWTTGTAPGASDIALFDSTYATTGTLSAGTVVDWGGIRLTNPGGAVLVNTGTIGLGSSGIDMSSSTVDMVIKNYKLMATQQWNIGSGRTFRIGDTTATAGGGTQRAGTFANSSSGATITKTGAGTVILDVANTSLGNVNWAVNNGLIRAIWNSPSAWGTGTIALGGGGIAVGTPFSGSVGNWTWNNPITLSNATSSYIDNQNVSGSARWLKLEGVISGSGNVEFRDTGTGFDDANYGFILAGANTFTGTMTIASTAEVRVGGVAPGTQSQNTGNNGTLGASTAPVVNNGTLSFSRLDAHTVANPISGSGAVRIGLSATIGTTTATQDVLMSGSNSYSGGTTLWNGRLRVGNASALGAGAVTLNSGTLDLGGTSVAVGLLSGSSGATITSSTTGNVTLTANSASSGTFAGIIASGSGTIGLTKQGGGTLTLSGNNAYTGVTTVAGGVLSVAADSNLGGVPGSATAGSLVISGGTLSASTGFTLNANRGIAVGPASGSGVGTIDVASGQTLSYAGIVSDNPGGTGGLAKSGAGTLALSGSNSYSGGTTLNSGTVRLGGGSALGATTGALTVNAGTLDLFGNSVTVGLLTGSSGGTITSNTTGGVTLTASSASSGTFGGAITSGAGSVAFTKDGAGTLTLTGSSAVSQATINAGTLRMLGGSGTASLGSGIPLAVAAGATLDWAQDVSSNMVISGAGTIRRTTTTGNSSFSGDNSSFTGAWVVTSGNLGFTNDTAVGASNVGVTLDGGSLYFTQTGQTLAATRTVTLGASGGTLGGSTGHEVTFASRFTGNGSLTKVSGATAILSGSNDYTGGTILNVGQLNLENASAIGTGTLTIAGGSIGNSSGGAVTLTTNNVQNWNSNFSFVGSNPLNLGTGAVTLSANRQVTVTSSTLTVGGAISGAFSLTKDGAGALRLNGANPFTGGFVLAGGTAIAGNGRAFGSNGSNSGAITLQSGVMDLNGQFNYTHTDSLKEYLINGQNLTFGGAAGGTMTLQDTGATPTGFGIFSGGIVYNATNNPGPATISARWIGVGASGATSRVVNVGDSSATSVELDFTGQMSTSASTDGSNTTIQKTGAGAMRISGSNFFPILQVTAGRLIVNNANALGARRTNNGTVENLVTVDGGTLDLNGFSPAIGGLSGGGVTTGTITNTAVSTASVLATGSSNAATTFGGRIIDGSGTVGLVKLGTGALTLSASNSYSGGTTLSSGTIVLGNGSALGTASSPLTLNAGTLDLAGNSVAVGLLTGSSGATLTTNTAGSIVLTASSAGSSTFSSTIASGSGTIGLTKQGAGTLTLAASNAYMGATTIAGGTLAVSSDANLGTAPGSATAGHLVIAGALAATSPFTLSSNRGMALGPAAGDGDGTISVTSGTLAYGGIIANNGAGTDGLVKAGAGSLRLTGVATYSGATTISGGRLEIAGSGQLGSGAYAGAIANAGTLRFESSANQTLSGGMSGVGSLQKAGAGRLTLLGANSYSGPTTVDGGSLVVNGLVSSSTITVSGGAILGGSGTTADVALVGGVVSPGNSPGTLTVANMSWNSTSSYTWQMYDYAAGAGTGWDQIVGTGGLTVTGTGFTFNLVSLSGIDTPGPAFNWSQTTSGTFRLATFDGGITTPGGAWYTINTGGFTPFSGLTGAFSIASGATTLDLVYTYTPPPGYEWTGGTGSWSVASNWSTDPLVPEGTSEILFSGVGGTSTNDLVSGTGTGQLAVVTGLSFSGSAGGSYTVDGNAFNLGSLGVVNNSAFPQTVANGMTLTAASLANAAAGPLTLSGTIDTAGYVFTVTGGSNTTLTGIVTGSGGLAKLGAGTLTLAGANDYTGVTTITGGTVVVGDGGTSGVLPGNVTNNSSLVFDRSDGVTYSGIISGAGSVTKLNANMLTLTGSNSYSGATTIAGGTLAFSSAANQTLSGAITGAGTLAKEGAGTLTLTGSGNYTGGTTISAGTLQLGSGGTTGSITGAVNNNGVLAFNRSDAVTFDGIIGGSGSVTQAGAGSTTLTAVNTYAGATTITSGTLAIGGAGQLGGGAYAAAVANAGVFSIETSANQTLSGTISGAGSLRKSGVGTLTLTAANTYSGGSTLSAGTLLVGNNAALGTGTATLNGGTLSSDGGTARTLANALMIGGDLTLGDATSNGLLAFSGNVGLGGAVRQLTLPSDVTLSGTLANGGVTKAGAGTLRLSGSSTYTLGTSLVSGAIVAANSGALGVSGTVTLNTAATGAANTSLLIDASGASVTITRAISVANQGSGVTTIGSGSLASTNQATFSGPITLAKNVTLVAATSGDRTQFTGGIGGTGNVTVTTAGSGRVIFVTASNSFTGNVTVSPSSRLQLGDGAASTVSLIPDSADVMIGAGGRLQLSKAANSETINALLGSGTVEINNNTAGLASTLIVGSAGGSGTFSGVLSNGNGVLLFTKQGAGTQVLTASNSYTGATTLSQGTLRVTGAGVLGGLAGSTSDSNNIWFTDTNSNAALEFETAANLGPADQVRFRNTGGTIGQGSAMRYIGTTTQTVSKTIQCDTSIGIRLESDSVGGAVIFNGAFSQTNRALYLGGSGTGDNELGSVFAGSGVLTKRDAGTWVLSGSNTYSGGTELIGGTLKVSSLSNIGSGYLSAKFGSTFVYTGSGTETTTRNLFLDQGAATITMANAAGSVTWNDSSLKNQSFTKNGPGQLTIGGAFTGGASVTVNDGTLRLTSAAGAYTGTTAINGGATLGFASGALGTGTIAMNGGTLQWLSSNTQDVSSRLVLANGTSATFDTGANVVTFATGFGGGSTSTVVKGGAGTLAFSGSNNYSGGTQVNAGTLSFASGGLGSTGNVTLAAATTLRWASGNTQDISDRLVLPSSGGVTLDSGANAVSLGTALGGASLAITKAGSGRLTLTAAAGYGGATIVSGGTLALSGAGSVASSSGLNVSASGATFDISTAGGNRTIGSFEGVAGSAVTLGANVLTAGGSGATTFAGVMSGAGGGFTKAGAGLLALTAVQAFTGPATVAAGVLQISQTNALAAASRIDVLEDATLDALTGLTVVNGQTLGGYGTVDGALTFASGATLSPGGSVGQLDGVGGTATLSGGMTYLFEVNDADGTAGLSPGWDLFTTTGAITLDATTGNRIILDITSLNGAVGGQAADFDKNSNYAWKFLAAGPLNPITFDADWFDVRFGNFMNETNGTFSVARGDQMQGIGKSGESNELYVVYAAVPEPGTLALAGIGLAAAGWMVARRRRRAT